MMSKVRSALSKKNALLLSWQRGAYDTLFLALLDSTE